MAQMTNSKLFNEAKCYMPGGVSSPVRSFKAVGECPIFMREGKGSKIYGEFGSAFIDYCLSWGALILGHSHPKVISALSQAIKHGTSFGTVTKLEIELAKLIVEAMPSMEQVRFTSSGTEAVMGAIRLARAYAKKDKIIKFEGSYHGHADYLLVKSGSGPSTFGMPDSLGVPADFTKHTIISEFNNIKNVEEIVKQFKNDLAAIIVEPIMANCGVILPKNDFLQALRKISDKYGIILIFDEVITGFRLSYGGAQGFFGVKPDLTCLGKIVGGGLPIGAFGGRSEIMKLLAPVGDVYQAGTLSGNPISVTAGIATLKALKKSRSYQSLERKTKRLCEDIRLISKDCGVNIEINFIGSIFSIFFADQEIVDYNSAKRQNLNLFKMFFQGLLKRGIYFSPSGFEADFLSIAHTSEDIEKTLEGVEKTFKDIKHTIKTTYDSGD